MSGEKAGEPVDPASVGEVRERAPRRIVPKFMELHRAGRGWRCRGCGEMIAEGGRAIGVIGLYGPNAKPLTPLTDAEVKR